MTSINESTPDLAVNTDFSLKILFSSGFGLKDLDLLETISTGIFGRTRLVKALTDKKYYALKIVKKAQIVKNQQLQHCQNEVKILSRTRCSFVIDMKAFFQDENSLYVLLDFIPGGELYSHLRKNIRFTPEVYQFYAVEVACALKYLHYQNILYRDLKPENISINKLGHVRLTEFILAKVIEDRTYTLCGTPEYLAPEVIMSKGYGFSVDWWSFGVLLYEMAVGYTCFYGKNPFSIYKNIMEGKFNFPSELAIPKQTKLIINCLLIEDRKARLGCGKGGFNAFKQHSFFKGIDWNSASQELMIAPVIPTVISDGDTSNYDFYPEEIHEEPSNLSSEERLMFKGFEAIIDR